MIVGLTGGIGSGKSTVATTFRELGGFVVDADAVQREVVEPGSDGLAAIVERFGDDVLAPDGTLDRPVLSAIVFADDSARRDLEAITHPRIAARTLELFGQAPAGSVLVHDIPLLVELSRGGDYDLVVVVDAPEEVRLERLVRDRGMTVEAARSRISAQATTEQRRAVADVWIDNVGTREELTEKARTVWAERVVGGAV